MKSKILFLLTLFVVSTSCTDMLDEVQHSEITDDIYNQFFETDGLAIANATVGAAISGTRIVQNNMVAFLHAPSLMTGEVVGRLGLWEGSVSIPFMDYGWGSDQFMLNNVYNGRYGVITNCNQVINVFLPVANDSTTEIIRGRALLLRGYAYFMIYDMYGQFVINQSTPDNIVENQPRATDEESRQQIIDDLTEAAELLNNTVGKVGSLTKGAALGILTKFYLNTKDWDNAAATAKEVMDLGVYILDDDYGSIFKQTSENSEEIVWGIPYQINQNNEGNNFNSLTLPGNYLLEGTQTMFPARMEVPAAFVESFPEGDVRKNEYILEYPTNNGGSATLPDGNFVPYKYGQDPGANGGNGGTDYIAIRYADILLSRAEALNELNGPNQETIDLINQVRARANAPLLQLSSFNSTQQLREAILRERAWEFHLEGLRRQDMIRHGKLISDAQDRGKAAQDFHVLFPLPQTEIDNNNSEGMFQNEGY